MEAYDVVVVGAGPAGSTAARYASLGGARVLLLERRREVGSPVQCGEFLPATPELARMFPRAVNIEELFADAISFVRARTSGLRVVSPAGRSYRVPLAGLVLDRDRFDRSLAGAAVEAGVELRTGTRVTAVKGDVVETSRGEVRARVVIGADGPNSLVARGTGLGRLRHLACGVQYLVRGIAFDPETVEMYFGPIAKGGYGWVIPKGSDVANVGVGVRGAVRRASLRREVLDPFVRAVEARSGVKGEVVRFTAGLMPVGGPRRSTVRANVLLAGDAAGHLMPANGGGVPTAVICGQAAGEVAAAHVRDGVPLSEYERRWRHDVGPELGRAVATRRLFDAVTGSDILAELAMALAGPRGMRGLLTCGAWYEAAAHVLS